MSASKDYNAFRTADSASAVARQSKNNIVQERSLNPRRVHDIASDLER